MTVKAMILAAGRGERMRPLTDVLPKPLITVKGRPLIDYPLEKLAAAGVREVVINLGYRGAALRRHVGSGKRYALRVSYSDEGEPPLESGGGILRALPMLGENPFLLVNADVYSDFPFLPLTRRAASFPPERFAHLVLVANPVFKGDGDFALEGDRVVDAAMLTHTFSGISILRPQLFAGCEPGRFPLAPLLRAAVAQGRVGGEAFHGLWSDVGTPGRRAELEARLRGF